MIIVDTGSLVALFSPHDKYHQLCKIILSKQNAVLTTTTPILTEVFYLLGSGTHAEKAFHDFIDQDGLKITYLNDKLFNKTRRFMAQYDNNPIDFADASLLALMEAMKTNLIFTLNQKDFSRYRIKKGHRYYPLKIIN